MARKKRATSYGCLRFMPLIRQTTKRTEIFLKKDIGGWINGWIKITLLASLLAGIGLDAAAQSLQPIDPLQRPKTGAGSSSFSLQTSYLPTLTSEGSRLGLGLGLRGSYNVTDRFAVTGSTGLSLFRAERLQDNGSVSTQSGQVWHGLSVGAQYTATSLFAPTIGLEVDLPINKFPLSVTVNTGVSWLRDPLILDASLAYTVRPDSSMWSAGVGMGFVVNDAVTLRADVVHSLTLAQITLPSGRISVGGAYKVDEQQSITLESTLDMFAGKVSPSLRAGYIYRPTQGSGAESTSKASP